MSNENKLKQNIPVAIIGMGGLFPKSPGLKEYWRLLFHGEDGITEVPETHWSPEDYFDENPKKPDHVYCTRGGFLSPISFNPAEFGIPPASLEAVDTSQLLGLVASKMALEDAGYGKNRTFNRDKASVILGVTGTQELVLPLAARLGYPKWRNALMTSGTPPEKIDEILARMSDSYVKWQESSFPGLLGNVVAGRICNRLDLGGTNCVVDAACASALSALHLALLELMSGRSDIVVTGGVDTLNDIFMHMCFAKTHTLSRTGDARPFSEFADGTVLGEGIGILVLKRLEDAERDGDKIYAVIKGLGSSSDGKSQSIYSPRVEGQYRALRMAYDNANIDPATVELVEAHGTGTRVGDAVEFQTLNRIFGGSAQNGNRCALGSVKSMIGHTKAAAGAAGVIKAALSLYNKVLPPTLKADPPDPNLGLNESPFYLSAGSRPWFSQKGHTRRSGVSAFGFGGSNFHVVLEEYSPDKQVISWDGSVEILALSGNTREELFETLSTLKKAVESGLSHQEFSFRASNFRSDFSHNDPHRMLLVLERAYDPAGHPSPETLKTLSTALDVLEAKDQNASWGERNVFYSGSEPSGRMAFIFPGQGSQYVGMGRDLISTFPQAFHVLETANKKYETAGRLTDFIFPLPGHSEEEKQIQDKMLRQTENAQPAIGAVSLAMLKILQVFGVKPEATCGHSFGELTALCAAGWIDEETFFDLSMSRGNLMASAGRDKRNGNGIMLAVNAPLNELDSLIEEMDTEVILANRNSPVQGVLSGSTDEIAKIETACKQKGYRTKRLPVSAAFHSRFVKDAQEPFMDIVRKIHMVPSETPVLSNTTGKPYPADPEAAKILLGEQLAKPVNFMEEVENLYGMGFRTFIEVGPRSILTGLVKSILPDRDVTAISLDHSSGRQFGVADLARLLCHVGAAGYPVDFSLWEQPVKEPEKQIMSIPICGVNYRSPNPKACSGVSKPVEDGHVSRKQIRTPVGKIEVPSDRNRQKMDNRQSKKPDVIANAFQVVQEGLKSMQSLQKQTAETHKKFLETQAEATRTLQKMMEKTQRLAEASLDIKPEFSIPEIPDHYRHQEQEEAVLPVEATGILRADTAATLSSDTQKDLERTMLETVSRLTGYPVEMIGLDMDIEADLGIDSIKRVEILSALEEKMPDLPSVSPEHMGSLKTLGQISEYLTEEAKDDTPVDHETQNEETITFAAETESTGLFNVEREELEHTMLETVSRLTGYPVEMIGLDMDIEADLGIDSIKRVEILSALEEKMPDLPSVSPEHMGSLKTLGQISEYLSDRTHAESHQPLVETGPACSPVGYSETDSYVSEGLSDNIERRTVSIKETPSHPGEGLSIPAGRKIYITDDGTGLAKAISQAFSASEIETVLISPDAVSEPKGISRAAGLIIIPNLQSELKASDLRDAVLMAKLAAPELLESGKSGHAVFATISRMDGTFGFKRTNNFDPMQGGLAGLAKTAAAEWKGVICRAIDIALDWEEVEEIAQAVVRELSTPDPSGPVEIGLGRNSRIFLQLSPSGHSPGQEIPIDLTPGDPVIVTGGARGVTAAATLALAKYARPLLVLLGRSPHPVPEPAWLASLTDEADIKKAILDNEYADNSASPMQIEQNFKKHMANREISMNLEKMRQTGASVLYYSVDIRDPESVQKILDEVRAKHGLIKGIIHGAGVLEDRFIIDKTSEQFEKVFETKVTGLRVLLEAAKQDPLKHIVLFSSVSARFGNKGQVDYAMANEVLNKTAQQESMKRPNCNVVSINWGPWDGGMVTPALKREFKRNNIDLIPVDTGALCMLREMAKADHSPVEVIIGAGIIPEKPKMESRAAMNSKTDRPGKKERLSIAFKRELDAERYPILQAHILGGKPVVPFALISEWLGHGALHENPGLLLHGIDDMRLLNGIKLDHGKRAIRLLAGRARKKGEIYEVDVELRDGIKDGIEVVHSKAKAILTGQLLPPPAFEQSSHPASKPYPRSMDEVYEKILFHGRQMRGIREIINYSSEGMTARVSTAPSPSEWMEEPLRSRWVADPLVLDSAFQLAIIWSFEEFGLVCLPSYFASYRQYCRSFPSTDITAIMEVKEANKHKLRCDYTFLSEDNAVLARLIGYEAIMDPSFYKAFKPEYA